MQLSKKVCTKCNLEVCTIPERDCAQGVNGSNSLWWSTSFKVWAGKIWKPRIVTTRHISWSLCCVLWEFSHGSPQLVCVLLLHLPENTTSQRRDLTRVASWPWGVRKISSAAGESSISVLKKNHRREGRIWHLLLRPKVMKTKASQSQLLCHKKETNWFYENSVVYHSRLLVSLCALWSKLTLIDPIDVCNKDLVYCWSEQ